MLAMVFVRKTLGMLRGLLMNLDLEVWGARWWLWAWGLWWLCRVMGYGGEAGRGEGREVGRRKGNG